MLMAAAVLLQVILASAIALDKIREGERKAALRGLQETVRATALIVDRETAVEEVIARAAALEDGTRLLVPQK